MNLERKLFLLARPDFSLLFTNAEDPPKKPTENPIKSSVKSCWISKGDFQLELQSLNQSFWFENFEDERSEGTVQTMFDGNSNGRSIHQQHSKTFFQLWTFKVKTFNWVIIEVMWFIRIANAQRYSLELLNSTHMCNRRRSFAKIFREQQVRSGPQGALRFYESMLLKTCSKPFKKFGFQTGNSETKI